ncbi:hypothetical protein KC358_g53 [Hortaea werneckii]|nr:hypothetical protein KC358_g53 [Hortaea werneckii]
MQPNLLIPAYPNHPNLSIRNSCSNRHVLHLLTRSTRPRSRTSRQPSRQDRNRFISARHSRSHSDIALKRSRRRSEVSLLRIPNQHPRRPPRHGRNDRQVGVQTAAGAGPKPYRAAVQRAFRCARFEAVGGEEAFGGGAEARVALDVESAVRGVGLVELECHADMVRSLITLSGRRRQGSRL